MEQPRYHEIGIFRPVKAFVARCLGRNSIEEVKRSQIVDEGKTAAQARPVQLVLEGMAQNRWTDMGEYIEREDEL